MHSPGQPPEGPPECEKGTLGAILYANPAQTVPGETQWVDLVSAIAAGDQLALHALYERAHRIVFTLAIRIVNDRETAEEVTVDVFYDVWRRAGTYDAAGGPVVGWIMNQARSRAIDRLRFDQRKKRVNRSPEAPPTAVPERTPEQAHDAIEQGRLLREALNLLTPGERQAIEIAFFSELTYHEVAARLNEPPGTIKTRVRSGLGKLRRVLGAP